MLLSTAAIFLPSKLPGCWASTADSPTAAGRRPGLAADDTRSACRSLCLTA